MRQWLRRLFRRMDQGADWSAAIGRALRRLADAQSELSAITEAMRAILRRIARAEEQIEQLLDAIRKATEKLELARINENAEEIAFWTAELRRLEDELAELRRAIEAWRRRITQLEQEQQDAANRVAEAQRAADNAEMNQGSPTDY